MSQRETVLAAIATAVAGVASGRIYRSRLESLPTLPAVIITPANEETIEEFIGASGHRLTVDLSVYAKGDTPDTAADAVISALWSALWSSPDLGLGDSVQLQPGNSIDWDFEDFDHVRAQLRVVIHYRTVTGAL
jgi:hypothetical protein